VVDSLCIPQDTDPTSRLAEEKRNQIGAMADIYRGADLTIAACSDPNSNKGLTGIGKGTRPPQMTSAIGSFTFIVTNPNMDETVKKSAWNKRIWMFQEAALSCRILHFTDHQVFFLCNGAMWSEELFLETPERDDIRAIDLPHAPLPYWRFPNPQKELEFGEWMDGISDYTRRTGKEEADFPLAAEILKPKDGRSHCCIPEKFFPRALCFETWEGKQSGLDSPTWCWCHWKVHRGIGFDPATERNLAPRSYYRPFSKAGYRSAEQGLCPIARNNVEPTSSLYAVKIPGLVTFCSYVRKGILSVGEDGLLENCWISFPCLHPGLGSTTVGKRGVTILALDCGKGEGDTVTCVELGYEDTTGQVRFLVVENSGGFSRRIGTGSIDLYSWELATSGLKKEQIFLA
jgi:hypothetical protein